MKIRQVGRKAISLLLVLAFVFSLSAAALAAEETTAYAMDDYGNTYTSYQEAWAAARKGTTITLTCDWTINGYLELGKDETTNVNMNGHTIARNTSFADEGEVLLLDEGASLTLRGCDINRKDVKQELTSGNQTGGLITGGKSYDRGGGIEMKAGAWLTLDNVTVASNSVEADKIDLNTNVSGGGIYLAGDKCHLYLTNSASIETNIADGDGGGIFIDGKDCVVSLKQNSRVYWNQSGRDGGGIYVNASGAVITLEGKSTIDSNISNMEGGGIYLDDTKFSIRSDDNTGKIINNQAPGNDGGAIYIASVNSAEASTISGLWMYNNYAEEDGGAIYNDQEKVTIKNCKFTDNRSDSEGGAIYIDNDECVVDSCTITDNYAYAAGGGIFCSCNNDFAFKGKVIVADNTDSDGVKNNVYLNSIYWGFAYTTSHLIGAPSEDSWIGIHAAYIYGTKRLIGEADTYPSTAFFSDYTNWYLESKEDNLWLIQGERYNLTVNGKHVGSYAEGDTVTIDGTPDDSNVFVKWNYSAKDVTYADSTAAITTFVMPAHDVEVTANYVEKTYKFTLTVLAPVAGEELATKGLISWKTSEGYTSTATRSVIWLEEVDGKTQTVSGKAEYGKTYSVAAVLEQNPAGSIAFDENAAVYVKYTDADGQGTEEAAYLAKIDEAGALRIYGNQISTYNAKVTEDATATVNIKQGSSEVALLAALPETFILQTEDGTKAVPATYSEDALDDVDLSTAGTYTVTPTILYDDLNLDQNNTTATVIVNDVADNVLTPPAASRTSGTYTSASEGVTENADQSISMQVSLNNTDAGATSITYILITSYESGTGKESKVDVDVAYNTPITLEAAHGERVTYILSAVSSGTGYCDSSRATYTYVLDNPYTVTVQGIDTGKMTGGTAGELYSPKTYYYHTGATVVIGAAAVNGELFEKWADASGITVTDEQATEMALRIDSLSSDIKLTAIYNPVITEISVTMDAPETGEALPESGDYTVSAVSSAYTDAYDVTSLFSSISWTPDTIDASAGIAYTAALTAVASQDSTSGAKILLADNLVIHVKDSTGKDVTASTAAQVENGNQLTLYLTFPETTAKTVPAPVHPVNPHPSADDKKADLTVTDVKTDEKATLSVSDVTPNDWFYDDVVYAYENGLMAGTSSDRFSPYLATTRGMVVTILYRLAGEPTISGANSFYDVKNGSYYEDAVTWASANKIVEGYGNGNFGPDDNITREQLAAILWRYAKYQGEDVTVGESANVMNFADAASISDYAVTVMQWAVSEGLVQGSNGKLDPQGNATRAQVAAILHRFCER